MIVAGVLDIETTGLKQEDGHRIIELAIGLTKSIDGVHFEPMGKVMTWRCNPMRKIDAKAQMVHGISIEDLKDKPEWEELAPTVQKVLNKMHLMVAHNAAFDAPFVANELARVDLKVPKLEVLCTMEQGRHATALGTVPSLEALCLAYGETYNPEEAHAADYDVQKTMNCFIKGMRYGRFKLPEVLKVNIDGNGQN